MAPTPHQDQKFLAYWRQKRLIKHRFVLGWACFWGFGITYTGYMVPINFNFSAIEYPQLLFSVVFVRCLIFLRPVALYSPRKKIKNLSLPAPPGQPRQLK